jgi:hypothetical protein
MSLTPEYQAGSVPPAAETNTSVSLTLNDTSMRVTNLPGRPTSGTRASPTSTLRQSRHGMPSASCALTSSTLLIGLSCFWADSVL